MQTKCTAPRDASARAEDFRKKTPEFFLGHLPGSHRKLAMSSPLIGVTVCPDVVRGIQESSINFRIVADDDSKKVEVKTVTATDAVLATNPNAADACTSLSRKGRNRLVIWVVFGRREHIDLATRKSREGQVEIDLELAKFLEF